MKKMYRIVIILLFAGINMSAKALAANDVMAKEPMAKEPTVQQPIYASLVNVDMATEPTAQATPIVMPRRKVNSTSVSVSNSATPVVGYSSKGLYSTSDNSVHSSAGQISSGMTPINSVRASSPSMLGLSLPHSILINGTKNPDMNTVSVMLTTDGEEDDEEDVAPPTPHGKIVTMPIGSGNMILLVLVAIYAIIKFVTLRKDNQNK